MATLINFTSKNKSRLYKITILASFIIFIIGNLAWAQGKGYFFESANEFYLLDNLFINGYLVVEETLSPATGLVGDVLVGNNFSLDVDSKVYFCKDLKDGNKDCSQQSLIWKAASLDVLEPNFYQLQTNKIYAENSDINLKAAEGKEISTNRPVKIDHGFSNVENMVPADNQLITQNLYLDNLTNLNKFCMDTSYHFLFPPQTCNDSSQCSGGTCLDLIKVYATNLNFKKLDLGDSSTPSQINLQNICYETGTGSTCVGAQGGPGASGGNWTFTLGGANSPGSFSGSDNHKVCCFLSVTL